MILATIASGLIGAASAQAGTLTVYATPSSGCNLFTTNGGGSHFLAVPPCIGSPTIAIVGGGPTAPAPAGARMGLQTTAPPGITISSVIASPFAMVNINNGKGWGGGSYWAGGGHGWSAGAPAEIDGPFSSSYWGFQMICGWSSCPNSGEIALNTIQLTATENQGPGLTALGAHNLWYQTGRWIWNAPGDPWPITLAASDPSGVCNTWATVNNVTLPGPSASPDTSQWQQCPQPTWTTGQGATVDTRDYIPGAGQFPLALGAANAAGVPSQVSETLNVDNDPVAASFTTPNDANPSVWVNHPVTVDATASAGPSGIGGMNCSTDGASTKAYPAGGVTVNGDGVHAVSCTAWNNAIDPEGSPATGTGSITVHIDEAPPSVSFESQDPADPAHLTVDTADSESGVAGGTIQMAPAGTNNWASLPTSFDGRHLLADVNDSELSGTYTLRATSCDNVGNCASTDENLGLPLRLAAVSEVSFIKIHAPAITARERVLVGWHYKRVRRHHKLVSVRTGGHYITVRIVIRKNTACAQKRIQTSRHRWREITACRSPPASASPTASAPRFTDCCSARRAFRSPTSRSKSSPHPTTGLGTIATVSTDAKGEWSATLPPGPSRIIRGVYGGSPTILPASGTVRTIVPAKVRLISVSPRRVAWGGTVRIVGQLEGGYLPPGGALVRLRIGSVSAFTTYGVKEHVTGNGRFSTTYTFGLGGSVYQPYWFQIASLPIGDYPWAPADSRRLHVLVGGHP